ncbi:MAG: LTA synthase family protein, partial [Planctomycetota bacterium]
VLPEQFQRKTFRTHLGWCDEDLFTQALRTFDDAATDEPFFATLLTLSFHEDYAIPEGKVELEDPQANHPRQRKAIRYADRAIGRFIARARKTDWFDETIFVFVADHMGGWRQYPHTPTSYRIPLLIYAPDLLEPRRVSTLCSQTDVAPTVLSLLGGRYEHCFFGSDVLGRDRDKGSAWILDGEKIGLVSADGSAVTLPMGAKPSLWNWATPDQAEPIEQPSPAQQARRDELRRQTLAILQTATAIFSRGAHNVPADRQAE